MDSRRKAALRLAPMSVSSGPYPGAIARDHVAAAQPLARYTIVRRELDRPALVSDGTAPKASDVRRNAGDFALRQLPERGHSGFDTLVRITLRRAASSAAWVSLGRCRFGPRPPLPSCPWQRAHWDSNNFLPHAGSPAGTVGVCARACDTATAASIHRTISRLYARTRWYARLMTPSAEKTSVRPVEILNRRPRFISNRTSGFTESVIREMTRLAMEERRRQSGAGLPGFQRARRHQAGGPGGHRGRLQPIRHHLGRQTVPRCHRRQVPEVVRPGLRSGERNYGLLRIHRRHDRFHAGGHQSRRRGDRIRAVLRKLRSGYIVVRRRSGNWSRCARRIGPSIRTNCAGRSLRGPKPSS